ncbi:thiamine pyrophosphate-binding protein [Paraglaciecola arctica]|uniref:Thiamine pyrophosphate protein domain protein TPP-binding n=1 Tax=Paraglaciecola arctica BSs20135 TaxID=493475 RepID=K6YLN0_9ALTE|nr:thiamine pyrophosphate-binding protein [Paraglaciecola arctica]GAC19072.1 thiamine pyrophosphate protein domain protein TPP-binding [Paraglaciecola arctica BSs20135]
MNSKNDEFEEDGTVGELIAKFLVACELDAAFGVISIHNMPILDAFAKYGKINFVPSRGEAGGVNMADAYARVRGNLGVAVTSTGTAAGNAAGALVEAFTAGTPLLHITGQIESEHIDRDRAYIHEAPFQLEMLQSVSKFAYRIWSPESALGILREAVQCALTPPRGPVSIEIPIDVQKAQVKFPVNFSPLPIVETPLPTDQVDQLIAQFKTAKRPMLWLGGGSRHAAKAAERLANMGVGIVTSTNGRAVVSEDHPMSIGAFNATPFSEKLYQSVDLMVVVGSRLRSNETWNYDLALPKNLIVADLDSKADGKTYKNNGFIYADSNKLLTYLADNLEGQLNLDPDLPVSIRETREQSEAALRKGLGPYNDLVNQLQDLYTNDMPWVRDVTLSNSMWGNRLLKIAEPLNGVHALGGGIGQGLPMGIGAAVAAGGKKVITLTGDGGLNLCIGEIATAAQEKVNMTLLIMNDSGYGVIRNIQDADYGSRQHYSSIQIPDYRLISESVGIPFFRVSKISDFSDIMKQALSIDGPAVVEVDMVTIGPFNTSFAGPPKRIKEDEA